MPGLAQRALWALAAMALLALAAALLLPTRYALGLGDLLVALAFGAHLVATLILALLLVPLAALFDLLLGHRLPHGSPRPPPSAPAFASHHGLEVGSILQSLLFWGVALAVLVYCCVMLWRQARRPIPVYGPLRRIAALLAGPFRWLIQVLLSGLRRGVAGAALIAGRLALGARGRRTVPHLAHPSWRHAGPRERVAYLYLSIEERARRLGLPRGRGQTASEYSRRLSERMPDLDPELRGLTTLFLEARYSPHAFDDARAAGARGLWKRVRARLRARRPSDQ